jgi:uncharacterized repeat protein (TIGR02543 family)/LPXTG-motif cell wall-anchored protein
MKNMRKRKGINQAVKLKMHFISKILAWMLVITLCSGNAMPVLAQEQPVNNVGNEIINETSDTPEVSDIPEASDTPGASDTPEISDTPGASDIPEVSSEAPEVSDTPEASEAEEISEMETENPPKTEETQDETANMIQTYADGRTKVSIAPFTFELSGDQTATITRCTQERGGDHEDLVIPSTITVSGVDYTVTKIAENAFQWYTVSGEIIIPDTITSIGAGGFNYNPNLKAITIGSGVQEIGNGAFSVLEGLQSVVIKPGVAMIPQGCFEGAFALTSIEIPGSVKTIGEDAFLRCRKLESVTFGDGIEYINKAAFNGAALKEVHIPGSVKTIGVNAFPFMDSLTKVTIDEGVERIEAGAFAYAPNLTTINLPSTVTYIGYSAFQDCGAADLSFLYEYLERRGVAGLGHSNIFLKLDKEGRLWDVIKEIFKGTFSVPSDNYTGDLKLDEWADGFEYDSKQGSENGTTQLTKSARWTNEDKTEAELRIDFAYLVPQNTDVVFVMDDSTSVLEVTADDRSNAAYGMISKVYDASRALLSNPGTNNRVAFSAFGSTVTGSLDFTNDLSSVEGFLRSEAAVTGGSTVYSAGLGEAQKFVENKDDKSRKTVVIFMTDGGPTKDGGSDVNGIYGGTEAKALRDAGAVIFGIMLDVPTAEVEAARKNIIAITDDANRLFDVRNNEALNSAVNAILLGESKDIKLSDTLSEHFSGNVDEVSVTEGTVTYDNATKKFEWNLPAITPNQTVTLTAKLKLDDETASGVLPTNEGDASVYDITDGDKELNKVETPNLNRDKIPSYSVKYDTGFIDIVIEDKENVRWNDENLLPQTPQKEGYDFIRWEIDEREVLATDKYSDLTTDQTDGTFITLKAVWEAHKYKVIFDKNATEALGTMEDQVFLFDEEKALSGNQFTRENHIFAGWAAKPDGEVIYTDMQAVKNLTTEKDGEVYLYAVWNEIGDANYRVEHYKQNKDGTWPKKASDAETETAKPGTKVNGQAKTYEGFVYDSSIKDSILSGVVKEDGSLVLKLYYRIKHTVIFDSDGGDYTPGDQNVNHGDQAAKPKDPVKDGYVFDGWYYTDKDGKEHQWNFGDEVNGDMKLIAHWKEANKPAKPSKPSTGGGNTSTNTNTTNTNTSNTNANVKGTTTSPVKTGDTTNIILLFSLLVGSAVVGAAILVGRKRKRR